MKCPRQISMPSGIQLWLEEQLEARGVDSAVYSKYILSALCSDSDQPVKPKDCRVRILIEELSEKLKGFLEKDQISPKDSTPYKSLDGSQSHSLQEKTFRYYSAFPQATSKSKAEPIFSSIGSSNIWSGKRVFGSSVGKNRTFSEGNNRDNIFNSNFNWLEENKENNVSNKSVQEKMRSRSTVKQTPEKVSRTMAKSLDRKDGFSCKSEISKSRRLYQQSTDIAVDESIQALWTCEKSFDDLTGCDQDLPMDFQQLLESPESTKMFSRCIGTKQPPSFIQCGTNITSSIWSEKAEDTMECSMIGDIGNDSNVCLNLSKSVWSMPNTVSFGGPEALQEPSKSNFWGTDETNVFASNSWKAVGNVDNRETAGDFGKWSDIESTSLVLNDVDTYFSSMGSNIHNSLTTLNHNKEDSSFTEVIPKVNNTSFSMTKEAINAEPSVSDETTTSKKDEEDLLTSMKTHFRPIKQETVEVVPSTAATRFPDGTTFPISNSLEKLTFNKSPGGGLYLDSDANNKYMEFNDAEDKIPSQFVPKFRVRQNEKFCQTDEAANKIESDFDELYFPEDEKLVRRMVEEEEVEEEESTFWGGEACIKVNGWMATWPTSGIWSNEPNVQQIWCGGSLWNNASEMCEAEKANNNINKGDEVEDKGGDQYTQLRKEWTQEAEELFSDISQHLYLANYMDTQPPKIVEVESTVIVRGVSRDRKRRHWSSQLGASSQPTPSHGPSPSRPLTL